MTRGDKWVAYYTLGFAGLSVVSIVISLVVTRFHSLQKPPLRIQFAYPVTSIDPVIYDDWESVFIGNHIYPRLVPEENRPWIPSVVKELSLKCEKPNSSRVDDTCEIVRISFVPTATTDCMGRSISIEDIRNEFEQLMKAKSWTLPGWTRCESSANEICIRGRNTQDIARRMKNVNFRFGWSKRKPDDKIFGVGPYCLHASTDKSGSFTSGVLQPTGQVKDFPPIEFKVSQSKSESFNFAIYGSTNLLQGKRRNVQAHTPLAYYVVTSPSLSQYRLPWNTEKTKEIINAYLVSHEVFFPENQYLSALAPKGAALKPAMEPPKKLDRVAQFMIPDYLPQCPKLADLLNKEWGSGSRAKAVCTDIVTYVVDRVRGKKGSWDGFVAGVSASDPGRDSLRHQYFSPYSEESWTSNYSTPDDLIYLVGMGQSLVTVDGESVCDVRPNPLGLGDIAITDLLPCKS